MPVVSNALNNLSQSLGTGLAGLGQARADRARTALEQGLMQRQMRLQDEDRARQTELYNLERPAKQLAGQKAQAELNRRNSPVTVAAIFPNLSAIEHAIYKSKGEQKDLREKFGDLFGTTLDLNKTSRTYGQFVKKDGSNLTMGEVEDNAQAVQGLFLANYDIRKGLRDQYKEYARSLESIAQKDPQLKSQQAQEVVAKLADIEKKIRNPQTLIDIIDNQINALSAFKGEEYEKGIKRLQKDKEALYKMLPQPISAKDQSIIDKNIAQAGLAKARTAEVGKTKKGEEATLYNIGGRNYTMKDIDNEMTRIGGVLKDYDSDAIINYGSIANIENLGGEEKQTILDRITQIANTAENPRVKQAANRYLQFAEARGWFANGEQDTDRKKRYFLNDKTGEVQVVEDKPKSEKAEPPSPEPPPQEEPQLEVIGQTPQGVQIARAGNQYVAIDPETGNPRPLTREEKVYIQRLTAPRTKPIPMGFRKGNTVLPPSTPNPNRPVDPFTYVPR